MMLTAWHVCSQTGIQKDSVVISTQVAKNILIDLADYDRLVENRVEANLEGCIAIQKEKDTIISYMSYQNKLHKENLILSQKQLEIREDQLKVAVKSKNQRGFLFGSSGLAVGLIIGLLLAQ